MQYFEEQSLLNRLESLPSWKWIAFMLLCFERMVPNYERFSLEASFGDGAVLRSGLQAVWYWLATRQLPENLKDLRNACKAQAPDTENFQSDFTSAALDAANATEIVLDALEEPSPSMVVEVAGLSRDTIDLYVQAIRSLDPTAKTLNAAILADPLMQRELNRQRQDLQNHEGSDLELCILDHHRSCCRLMFKANSESRSTSAHITEPARSIMPSAFL